MSKNLISKKSLKITFFCKESEFLKELFFAERRKKWSLFLNIMNTQFNQSSLVQPNPETKNLEKFRKISKNHFFSKI